MNPVPPATPETRRADPRCLAMLEPVFAEYLSEFDIELESKIDS